MSRKRQVALAIDLGAESGRVIAGLWDGARLKLEEVHRFPNRPVQLGDSLRWNILGIWSEIQEGLALAAKRYASCISSVGCDSWGVDYVLLDKREELLGQAFHYRDVRTNGQMERTFRKVSRAEIFQCTGLQFMQLNTLFQLRAAREQTPECLASAETLLFIPDFVHWALCGSKSAEFTIASTSQCLDPITRDWARPLLKKLELPTRIFPKLISSGSELGTLRQSLAKKIQLGSIRVIAPPSHDTASAVAGVPTAHTGHSNWAYISSGTWSLMGVEVSKPFLDPRTQQLNLTNEGGLDGTVRLLKNIMGLWLVQQCKKSFDRRGLDYDYAELARQAASARPLRSLIEPDDASFLNPSDMPEAIQNFCRQTSQPVPRKPAELIRCVYESLALKYRRVLGWLEELTGNRIEVIHIVGGGSQSDILNQFTADACQRTVLAGPVEATAMGNLLVQLRAAGEISSLSQIREAVQRSSRVKNYYPGESTLWDKAAARFEAFKSG